MDSWLHSRFAAYTSFYSANVQTGWLWLVVAGMMLYMLLSYYSKSEIHLEKVLHVFIC